MASSALRWGSKATSQVVRQLRERPRDAAPPPEPTHVLLSNVPRTATPADIRRLCAKHKAVHVSRVAIDYHRFTPTGRAWLTITSPNFAQNTAKSLNRSMLGASTIASHPADPSAKTRPPFRTRGTKGRLEAAERGLVMGMGPDGGVSNQGRNVVIYGMPGKMTPESLREYLKSFKLAGSEGGQKEIIKLEVPEVQRVTFISRYFVRTSSISEAHRLVRRVHMTFFQSDIHGTRYPIRAQVLY
ncbi:uncharacterized protein FIBRA_04499 [Fibroporia radiculosa]|uniref:RRM domain-containing protein n=1 Tax=Fibroporia radiculosa TaxID=599839 RepID=J4IA71_9APHY|nr:uncharacterized protein FIBRA_04499 [Fibroporia radiculosa]CCM02401.1 predicted protein [Fibroporia radiculosa]